MTQEPMASLKDVRHELLKAARLAYSEGDRPVLRRSNVAFVDLLGASAMMNQLDDAELGRMLHALRDNVDFFDFFEAYEGPGRVVTFSDNIVACLPVDTDELDGGLAWHVIAAGQFQRNLALNGYFVRGGITVGPVYADDSAVIGSALVRAYSLEVGAVHPRVVLDPEVVTLFASGFVHEGNIDASLQNQVVVVDTVDDCVFVHYLEFMHEADDQEEMLRFLGGHRDEVVRRLGDTSLAQRVHEKYRWLAQYHNWHCNRLGLDDFAVMDVPMQEGRFMSLLDWMRSRGVDLAAVQRAWLAGARTVEALGLPTVIGASDPPTALLP